MAEDLRQQLTRLAVKSQMLVSRYETQRALNRQLAERIAELERALEERRSEEHSLRSQLENLKVAATLSPTREDVARSRVMLSEILREIDKCIEQLTY